MRGKIVLAIATGMMLVSCADDDAPVTPPDQPAVSPVYQRIIALQDSALSAFTRIVAAHRDSAAAKDSLVRLFQADTSVSWAQSGSQGVAVLYKSGIRGGLFLDPEDDPESTPWSMGRPWLAPDATPRTKRVAFFNVHYNERKAFADSIIRGYNARLGNVGFGLTTVRLGHDVTLSRLMHLADSAYGVVHIYSHGWAWPSKHAIQEVYLMTGERKTDATVDAWFDELQAKQLMIANTPTMGHVFFASPAFVATYNNFRKDTTLIYGGFCYSHLGSWPSTMVEIAGAGSYFGFDWKVRTRWNAYWSVNLFKYLCDTVEAAPWTVDRWLTSSQDMAKWYWNAEDNRNVHILLRGNPDLALRRLPPDTVTRVPSASFRISYVDYYYGGSSDSDRANLGNWKYDYVKGAVSGNVFTAAWGDTMRTWSDTLWSWHTLRAKIVNRELKADTITLIVDSKLYWGCTSRAVFRVTNLPVYAQYGNSYEYKLTGLDCAPHLSLAYTEWSPEGERIKYIRKFNVRTDTILRLYLTRYD